MSEDEYFTEKKKLLKKLDESFIKTWHKEISIEEHMKLHKAWRTLIENAKKESWFKHI